MRDDMVPGEGIEPPAFGLQNRCTTAVLTRPYGSSLPFSGTAFKSPHRIAHQIMTTRS